MRYNHITGVDVTPWFDDTRRYRYRLEILRRQATAGRTVCVVMQNPSCAGRDVADRSVKIMEKVVFEMGLPEFGDVRRLLIVNQFGRIQTRDFRGASADIGEGNDIEVENAVRESDIIVIAWGITNRFKRRQEFVLDLLRGMKGKHLLRTRMHPARVNYDGFIQPLDIRHSH